MSETAFIVAELVVGIAFLGVGSAVVTYVIARLMAKPAPAEEILRTRYARGDISREQFIRMREDLGVNVDVIARPTDSLVSSRKA